MKRYAILMLCLVATVLSGLAGAYKVDEIPNIHVANRTRYVSNPDNVLSPAAVATLDSTLSRLWRDTSSEVVVVAVNSVDGDPDEFATELFTKWGIGKKDNDNGMLVLIAKDDRKAVIRTGYGMEGVLPDILAGRIIRNIMAPHFRNGDYDNGTIASLTEIARITSTPGATEELMSKYGNDEGAGGSDGADLFKGWLAIGAILAVVLFVWFLYEMVKTRRLDRYERYQVLNKMKMPALILVFVGLGLPAISYLILWLTMRGLRLRHRNCPNCHNKMHRIDEANDNKYLTHQQDIEEQINSVDYDVWLCDHCGETDILPYINNASSYTVCPRCGARACSMRSQRIVIRPTERREGQGVKEYICRSCGNRNEIPYSIPKVVVPPVVIVGGGGRGFGGGGGGFSGGSFGGGMTGGGGASGGW